MKTSVSSGRPPAGAAGVNTRALRCTHRGRWYRCVCLGVVHTRAARTELSGAHVEVGPQGGSTRLPRRCTGRGADRCASASPCAVPPPTPPVTGQPRWRQEYKGAGGGTGPHPGARDKAFRPSAGQRPRVRLLFRAATVASPPLQRPQPSRARNPSPHRPPRHLSQGSAHPPAGRWGRVGTGRLSSGRAAASTDRGGQAGTASLPDAPLCIHAAAEPEALLSGRPSGRLHELTGQLGLLLPPPQRASAPLPVTEAQVPHGHRGLRPASPTYPAPTPFSKAPSCTSHTLLPLPEAFSLFASPSPSSDVIS